MPNLPCVMCGKEVFAMGGSNTIYNPSDGNKYANHNRRIDCDGGHGCYDTTVIWARLAGMTEEEKNKSRL